MHKPAPKSLQRRGLVQVADNLPPGAEVARFERDFALIFRDELVERFLTGPAEPASRPASRLGRARAAGGAGVGLDMNTTSPHGTVVVPCERIETEALPVATTGGRKKSATSARLTNGRPATKRTRVLAHEQAREEA